MGRNERRAEPRLDQRTGRYVLQIRYRRDGRMLSEQRSSADPDALRQWAAARWAELEEDRQLAHQVGRLRAAGVEIGRTADHGRTIPLFAAFASEFLAWLPDSQAKPLTIREYRNRLHRLLLPVLGPLRLDQITPARVDALRAAIAAEGTQPRPYLACLSAVLAHAVREGLLPANPCHRPGELRRAARGTGERREIAALTREQRAALIEAMPVGGPRTAVALLACLGLREAEVRGLMPEDLDLRRGELAVQRQLQRLGREWIEGAPKYNSARVVPIPGCLVRLLEQEQRRALRSGHRHLFYPAGTGRPVSYLPKDPRWKEHLAIGRRDAGLPDGLQITPGMLRHTAYSLAVARLPVLFGEFMLGHASGSGVSAVSRSHYLARWTDHIDRELLGWECRRIAVVVSGGSAGIPESGSGCGSESGR